MRHVFTGAILIFCTSGCVSIGERPPYTYELLEVLKDYIPVLRSRAVKFYANAPVAVLERQGGIDVYGKVPVASSNKCEGQAATDSCLSIEVGSEILVYPEEYERLLYALQNPCSTFAKPNSVARSGPTSFKTERAISSKLTMSPEPSVATLIRIFGCSEYIRRRITLHVDVIDGLDAADLDTLPPMRRPSAEVLPRKELKLIRAITITTH